MQHDNTEIVHEFEGVKRNIDELIELLTEMDLLGYSLYDIDQKESELDDKAAICYIPAKAQTYDSKSSLLKELNHIFQPHYRTAEALSAPRLVGWVQFDGTDRQIDSVLRKIVDINEHKEAFGRLLKEHFPSMKRRTTYLRKQFGALITRSVHRNISDLGCVATASRLSWSDKQVRSTTITYETMKDIIRERLKESPKETVEQVIQMATKRLSTDERDVIVHQVPIKVHVVQNIHTSGGGRPAVKASQPLIVLGNTPFKVNHLDDYDSSVKKRNVNSSRYEWHPILPEYGLFQRTLRHDEWEIYVNKLNAG